LGLFWISPKINFPVQKKSTSSFQAVRWFSSALVVTHEACQLLLPELPVTSVAAALAATPLAQPPPGAPWETSTTSTTSTTSPVMDALAEALAVAMHEEMSCWGALADTLNVSQRISTVWKIRIVIHRILTRHVFFAARHGWITRSGL
jgi:hypothetical protein